MTKTDYVQVAAVIKEILENECEYEMEAEVAAKIAEGLSVVFKTNNARFDEVIFLAACGL